MKKLIILITLLAVPFTASAFIDPMVSGPLMTICSVFDTNDTSVILDSNRGDYTWNKVVAKNSYSKYGLNAPSLNVTEEGVHQVKLNISTCNDLDNNCTPKISLNADSVDDNSRSFLIKASRGLVLISDDKTGIAVAGPSGDKAVVYANMNESIVIKCRQGRSMMRKSLIKQGHKW